MSTRPNEFKIDDGMHDVLDSVLENIDDLLINNIPRFTPNTITNHTRRCDIALPENANHNLLSVSGTITRFGASTSLPLQIKNYVFISKDCTARLSSYIVCEEWGRDCGLLYKYLDYIFRCQAFAQQIVTIDNKYLIFHSGLQRRSDKQLLYALLIRNKKFVAQKWRVSFGNIKNSFCTKSELLRKFASLCDLPKRSKFYHSLSDLLYDDSCPIDVNWEERLTTNKDRIHRVLGNIAFFDSKVKFMKLSELIESFKLAMLRTKQIARLNPRLAVAQVFVDKKNSGYRVELLLPLIIEFPKASSNFYIFAVAMHKSPTQYVVKSVLTIDMAYSNARLLGYVDSNWLLSRSRNMRVRHINDFFSS
eukprot:176719_1